MKSYKDYMNNLSVDETLHEKIMNRSTQSSTRQHIMTNHFREYISVAVCAVVILISIISIYPHMNIRNITPYEPDTRQDGAIYHNIDASQIIRQNYAGKVMCGFWFYQNLMLMAKNETGIDINNGVRWDKTEFTKADMESALQTSIKDPLLPDGDYTVEQGVLIDEATGKIIAYQTNYLYFDKNTMEFQNSFSVFYFAEQQFISDKLEGLKNVTCIDGEINISEFPESKDVYAKIPHVRKLVYVENGIWVVVEAESNFVQNGSVVDKEKSLERYKQTDKQLIDIMKSLVE